MSRTLQRPLRIPATAISGRQHLRSAATGTLLVPHARTATGQRSFAVDGPATWNRLPPAQRSPDLSESAFKRALRRLHDSGVQTYLLKFTTTLFGVRGHWMCEEKCESNQQLPHLCEAIVNYISIIRFCPIWETLNIAVRLSYCLSVTHTSLSSLSRHLMPDTVNCVANWPRQKAR